MLCAVAMRIAVPVWRDRISPVFDVAGSLLLVDLQDGAPVLRNEASLQEEDRDVRARRLGDLGVDVLICGAISRPLEASLAAAGIKVIARVCGGVDDVLDAYRSGRLGDRAFAMPGCCGRRRGFGHGRRCGKGGRGARGDVG